MNEVMLNAGGKIELSKELDGDIKQVVVGLGWDESDSELNMDCDAYAFLLRGDRLVDKNDVVYYDNLTHSSGAVKHSGDNMTGEGTGDDEQISVRLDKLPEEYDSIVFAMNVFMGHVRGQDLSMVDNAYIRLLDKEGHLLCSYKISDKYSGKTALIFGAMKKIGKNWGFHAIGEAIEAGSVKELTAYFAGGGYGNNCK